MGEARLNMNRVSSVKDFFMKIWYECSFMKHMVIQGTPWMRH